MAPRKQSVPNRSLAASDKNCIRLDVFTALRQDPASLLWQRTVPVPKTAAAPAAAVVEQSDSEDDTLYSPTSEDEEDAATPWLTFPARIPVIEWKIEPLLPVPVCQSLHPAELQACSILRLRLDQYRAAKKVMLKKGRNGYLLKKEAKKLLRIDVNKTGKLWDWFYELGWMN